MRGPVEMLVVEFPGEVPGATFAPEIRRLVSQQIVRIIDILVVRKAMTGEVTTHELGEFEGNEHFEALDAAVQSVDGLVADSDVEALGEALSPGATAIVLLFEHLWAVNARRAMEEAGGAVVLMERIPGPVVDEIEAALV
jgi:hypothetical protein